MTQGSRPTSHILLPGIEHGNAWGGAFSIAGTGIQPFQVFGGHSCPWYSNRDAAAANPGRTPQMIMYSHSEPPQNPSIKSSPRKSRSRAGSHHANRYNVWCLTKVITFDSGRVGRIQEYVRNARAGLFDGISEEKTESLRISLGGASALTGHRQDARLVRIDAGAVPASFESGLQACR